MKPILVPLGSEADVLGPSLRYHLLKFDILNPNLWVGFGDRSIDDMLQCDVILAYLIPLRLPAILKPEPIFVSRPIFV